LKKGYDPLVVANYFIEHRHKHKEDRDGIHLMKLIKLCYFSHGFTLANTGEILINEYAEAWEYGPVFPTIFHEFKTARPIKEKARKYNPETKCLDFWSSNFTNDESSILEQVNTKYGVLSGFQLSTLTHKEDSPWSKAWEKGKRIKGYSISNDEIKEYFKKQISG